MKTRLCILFLLISASLYSQTYFSGGIYTNTTWTAANSPYIITDTVVVFPGVTLTIEPSVTVKFDDGFFIEMRNAGIIANGTVTDSIIFTSNSPSPVPGIWGGGNAGLWINGPSPGSSFRFCRIEYATTGINSPASIKNCMFLHNNAGLYLLTVPTDSCIFKYNGYGIYECADNLNFCDVSNNSIAFYWVNGAVMTNCKLDSNGLVSDDWEGGKIYYSSISYNTFSIRTHLQGGGVFDHCHINFNTNYGLLFTADGDSVRNCEFKYNATGINLAGHSGYGGNHVSDCDIMYNNIGIESGSNYSIPSGVTRCDISYNNVGVKVTSGNFSLACNRICGNTSYALQMNTPSPYNAMNNFWCTTDSVSTAAVIYDGYDNVTYGLVTFWPADTTACNVPTSVSSLQKTNTILFPNPSTGNFSIINEDALVKEIKICNTLGDVMYTQHASGKESEQVNANLSKGIYIVNLITVTGNETKMLVVQ